MGRRAFQWNVKNVRAPYVLVVHTLIEFANWKAKGSNDVVSSI